MASAERSPIRENERKKYPDLSRYSHNLSSQILEGSGVQKSQEIKTEILQSFQRGSISDRDSYWQEKQKTQNFGTQMLAWIGKGEQSGISQWLTKQTDSDVVAMLEEVGLKGSTEQTRKNLQDENVVRLLEVINTNLLEAGEKPLSPGNLSEEEARSLIFYANYLAGTNGTEDTKSFINTVVGVAQREAGGDLDATIAKLNKIAPLLAVVGEEAQFALGALIVAKTHAAITPEKVQQQTSGLNEDEQYVAEFINKHLFPESLTPGDSQEIVKIYQSLTPKPTPGHKYWVSGDIPSDFAKSLTSDQIRSLEQEKVLFSKETDAEGQEFWDISRNVFEPGHILRSDQRYINAIALTQGDSELFALAAASATTPEKQATLYQQLGEVVIRAHKENPKLLEAFLRVQDEASLSFLADNDSNRAHQDLQEAVLSQREEFLEALKKNLPGVDLTNAQALAQLTDEQAQIFNKTLLEMQLPIYREIMGSISAPYRMVVLDTNLSEKLGLEETVNIERTVAQWPERIKALEMALAKNPLSLTPEQIRQIEFLSHSVNTTAVIEWLNGSVGVGSIPEVSVPSPEASFPEVPTEEAKETLTDFFVHYEKLIEELKAPKPQREEMRIENSVQMREFSTADEDIRKFEILQDGMLGVFSISQGSDGRPTSTFNSHNEFIKRLTENGTISQVSLANLMEWGAGPNTFLAYVLEASITTLQRETLYKNLFLQIAKIYEEHPEVSKQVKEYLMQLGEQSPFLAETLEEGHATRLFDTPEVTHRRLKELSDQIQGNTEFTTQDMIDMGIFALPFNLQEIARLMNEQYRIGAATEEIHRGETTESGDLPNS